MLPKQSLDQRRVIAYLSKTRCLPVDVIIEQIRSRRLYQDDVQLHFSMPWPEWGAARRYQTGNVVQREICRSDSRKQCILWLALAASNGELQSSGNYGKLHQL